MTAPERELREELDIAIKRGDAWREEVRTMLNEESGRAPLIQRAEDGTLTILDRDNCDRVFPCAIEALDQMIADHNRMVTCIAAARTRAQTEIDESISYEADAVARDVLVALSCEVV